MVNIPTIPKWAEQILASPKAVEAVVAVERSAAVEPPTPDPETLEEYEAGIAEDDAEAEVLRSPEGDVRDDDQDEPDDVEPEPEVPEEPEPSGPPKPFPGFTAQIETRALRTFLERVGAIVGTRPRSSYGTVGGEAKVLADVDGWHARVVDPAHVMMVDVTLPFRAFSEHSFHWAANPPADGPAKPESVEFGLDVDKILRKLKPVKEDTVGLKFEDNEKAGTIHLALGRRQDSVGAIDTAGMSDPQLPKIDWTQTVSFRVPAKTLLAATKAAGEVSDHVFLAVQVDEDGRQHLFASAEGEVDTCREDLEGVEWIGGNDPRKSAYPLEPLAGFLKTAKDDTLTVFLGTEYPLRIDWDSQTVGTYLLAPRVECDA